MSPKRNTIGMDILGYLEKKKTDVTFKELYVVLKQFSEQGIRNSMYKLIENGAVVKTEIKPPEGRTRVSFKLKKK